MTDKIEKTNCYTYKVEMTVQIFAPTEDAARIQLDDSGGYLTSRKVKLLNSIEIPSQE